MGGRQKAGRQTEGQPPCEQWVAISEAISEDALVTLALCVSWQVRGVLMVRWAPLSTSHTFQIGAHPCRACCLSLLRVASLLSAAWRVRRGQGDERRT